MPKPSSGPAPDKGERLQVVLARCGIASRRGVVEIIESGRVSVNGKMVREKGFRVAPNDDVAVDGTPVAARFSHEKVYFLFHKPKGVMTTLQDPNAEKTVADFFQDIPDRVYPVGRLDRDTTGLLLMTNDGELAFRLTHPKFGVKKKYRAVVRGAVLDATVKRLEAGVELEEGPTAPCQIKILNKGPRATELSVVLHEGKKRQIRRIFQKVGHFVTELERLSYGPVSLGDLPKGQKRPLRAGEVRALYEAAGLKPSSSA